MIDFREGDKIICIDPVCDLVLGKVYTAKRIRQSKLVTKHYFVDIGGNGEWFAERFKKFIDEKEDVVTFKAGDKVRCVRDPHTSEMIVGEIYTVADVYTGKHDPAEPYVTVINKYGTRITGYYANRFQLISDNKKGTSNVSKFSVNSKVVCINTGSVNGISQSKTLVKDKIYYVTGTAENGELYLRDMDGKTFNPARFRAYDAGFSAECSHDEAVVSYNGDHVVTVVANHQTKVVYGAENDTKHHITKGQMYQVVEIDTPRQTYKIARDDKGQVGKWYKMARFSDTKPVEKKFVVCKNLQEHDGFGIAYMTIGKTYEVIGESMAYDGSGEIYRVVTDNGSTNSFHISIFKDVWYEYTDIFDRKMKLKADSKGMVFLNGKSVNPTYYSSSFKRI